MEIEIISMDFIIGLPKIVKQNDSIIVVVAKLSKGSHFIPLKSTYKAIIIADIFMKEIFRLHGVPKIVILDRDAKFIGNFWKVLFKGLAMQLNFSTTYHPQTDRQTKRLNHLLEDMLRIYVMDKPCKWEYYLHLVHLNITAIFKLQLD